MTFFFVGVKLGMTSLYDDIGQSYCVTILKILTIKVTKIYKYIFKNFYKVQIGFNLRTSPNCRQLKPQSGVFLKKKLSYFKYLKEFKIKNTINNIFEGIELNINFLNTGDFLTAKAYSTGKGYAGNIKKHNFKRGPMSHGSKHHRLQGSLGAGTSPGRVFPGKKMSGRLGGHFCTVSNLEVISLDYNNKILYLKGSVPGKKKNIVYLKKK